MSVIRVLGESPYDVTIGTGLLDEIVAASRMAHRVAIVVPEALTTTGDALREAMALAGPQAYLLVVPNAEEQKDAAVLTFLWQRLGELGFTRSDLVVGVGGGATTDLAGFAAATWARGIRWIAVPTTLVGMVDAAVGGKTGINVAAGKNLVGAFHPPAAVFCDVSTLESLPRNDLIAGLAEVIKCGFIRDPRILEIIEADPDAVTRFDSPALLEVMQRSIQVKADVVSVDLRESGEREILNYGHTLGHAIERAERFAWRHGAAVAVGMVFVAQLARLAGRLDDATADRHRTILQSVGLPIRYRGEWPALLDAMRVDKKARGDLLRFVILEGLARPARLEGPDPALLAAAFADISEES
jgi:3-dehydroquinate synthase